MIKKKKAQEWFDNKYTKEKGNIENIEISEERKGVFARKLDLVGPLKIEGFKKLKKISLKKLNLTSLEISNCSQLSNVELTELQLKNLSVSDCPRLDVSNLIDLTKLKCSKNNKLNNLDISECSKLEFLDCSHSQLTSLDLSNCSKLESLDCSHSQLTSLNLSNCSKLEFLDCSHNQLNSLDLRNCPDTINVNHRGKGKKDKIKNLLIIGRTGGGKSALANVLSGTGNFEESEYSISKTENSQKQDFEWNGSKYCVVDTIGVGNTKLSDRKEVWDKIVEGFYSVEEGINQVLLVIDVGFTAEEIAWFKLFEKIIFEIGIVKYTTIVRTKFNSFKNKDECEKDKSQLCKESETIAKIINKRSIVYVDNPSINILEGDDDDDGDAEIMIRINKKKRLKSRIVLLDHLEDVCQEDCYKLKTWDVLLRAKIANYFKSNGNQ